MADQRPLAMARGQCDFPHLLTVTDAPSKQIRQQNTRWTHTGLQVLDDVDNYIRDQELSV